MKLKEARAIYESRAELIRLGSGSFGQAYRTACGKVLKLGSLGDPTALWIEEACLHYLTTGQPMKYAPKVYAFQVLPGGWWAIMEYVTPEKIRRQCGAWSAEAPNAVLEYLVEWALDRNIDREDDYSFPDCHGANWGKGAKGRIIVFDPFAGHYGPGVRSVPARPAKLPKPHVIAALHKGPVAGRWARG